MGIFLQVKRHFHEQSYFSVIVIYVQLFSFMFNILGTRANSNIKLTQIFYDTSPYKNMSKIKYSSPDSIQKCINEFTRLLFWDMLETS